MNLREVFTRVIDMPYHIHGFTRPNVDGSFSVYLNAHDCNVQQKITYDHEVEHIENGDYDRCGIIVDMLEAERNE